MKDKKLKIGIDEIKKVAMTELERSDMYKNIMDFSVARKPISSPWFKYSFSIISSRSRLVYYIIVPLIIILSSGGVVFASQDSLPNSILYPLKVKIVEPVEGALSFSQKSKAVHESGLAKKRLIEAETLAEKGELDTSSEKKINNLLASHTKSLSKALVKVNDSDSPEEADDIVTSFRAEMNAHAKVLDSLKNIKNNSRNEKEEDNKIEKNKDKENSRDEKDIKVSNTARLSAKMIKKDSDKKEKNNIEKYEEKKEKVRSLISDTDIDIDFNSEKDSNRENFITEDTIKTIEEARAYLYDADKKGEEGDLDQAYSALLDSESSIKEANILIKKGLINNDNNDNEESQSDYQERED